MSARTPHRPTTLPDLGLEHWPVRIWELLEQAAGLPGDPLRTPGLASCGQAGPEARTVVLRAARSVSRLLLAYTDLRSFKVGQLQRDPRAAWLFYDPGRALQIRIRGLVRVHAGDTLATDCWAGLAEGARGNYLALPGPGLGLGSAEPGLSPGPGLLDPGQGPANFAVLACEAQSMDCLCLRDCGNVRAGFHWESAGWYGQWLCP